LFLQRSAAKLDDAQERVRDVSPTCESLKVATDIRDPAQCAHLVMAGCLPNQRDGSVQMTRAVAPVMKARGGGAVVMINTMATIKPFIGEAGYAASKGALLVAAKYLAIMGAVLDVNGGEALS
jgi:short chain dehydrogenase